MKETIKQIVQKITDELGEDEVCKYCIYEDGCAGGVTNYGSGPIYPPCADSPPEDWFDIDAYEEDKKEE